MSDRIKPPRRWVQVLGWVLLGVLAVFALGLIAGLGRGGEEDGPLSGRDGFQQAVRDDPKLAGYDMYQVVAEGWWACGVFGDVLPPHLIAILMEKERADGQRRWTRSEGASIISHAVLHLCPEYLGWFQRESDLAVAAERSAAGW